MASPVLDIRAIGKGFFDSAAVLEKLSAGERRVLSRWGAYVRIAARRSIRKRKRSAAPGSPPSSHEGSLKRLIFFAYDPAGHNVVAGPVPFRGKAGTTAAPELLEYGGVTSRKGKRLTYSGNPFMGPAAAAVQPKLAPDLATLLG